MHPREHQVLLSELFGINIHETCPYLQFNFSSFHVDDFILQKQEDSPNTYTRELLIKKIIHMQIPAELNRTKTAVFNCSPHLVVDSNSRNKRAW